MSTETVGLIISLAINAAQIGLAWHKQCLDKEITLKRITARTKEQAESHKYEMDKLMLNEDAYISRHLLPDARKACLDYILITKTEMNESHDFPVQFSVEQQKAEANVILYLPGTLDEITSFQETNKVQTKHQNLQVLNEDFDQKVIPVLANALGSFQQRKKQLPHQ